MPHHRSTPRRTRPVHSTEATRRLAARLEARERAWLAAGEREAARVPADLRRAGLL